MKKKFTNSDYSLGRICLGERMGKRERNPTEPGRTEAGDHIPYKLPTCSLILVCSLRSSHACYIAFWFQMDPIRPNLFIRDLLRICCMLHPC